MAQKHQNGDGAVQSGKGILSKGRGRPTNLAKRATKRRAKVRVLVSVFFRASAGDLGFLVCMGGCGYCLRGSVVGC